MMNIKSKLNDEYTLSNVKMNILYESNNTLYMHHFKDDAFSHKPYIPYPFTQASNAQHLSIYLYPYSMYYLFIVGNP